MLPIATQIVSTLHNILYVMAEGTAYQKNPAVARKTVFLFLIDFLQVVRVVTSPLYGWSEETASFVQNFDIVYLFTDVTSTVVPRYTFFILASILVLVALGDTVFVAHLFSQGEVNKLWPVKVLRMLVAALVTTFFSSVIKWLLIPIDCLVSEETSLSVYIHGDGSACNPWGTPEIFVSIPTLVLSVFYCIFALTASYFWLEINPLSCSPSAKCTGRVEICFLFMKIGATFLVYLADDISTVGTSSILLLFSFLVFVYHVRTLPFHDDFVNQYRGGIHAALMWLSFTAVVVAATNSEPEDGGPVVPHSQNMQWAFIGCMPGAAVLGAWIVTARRNQLSLLLDRLRGDWEARRPDRVGNAGSGSGDSDSGGVKMSKPSDVTGDVKEYFYNPSWERRRAFTSSSQAYAAIRVLLHKRNQDDQQFLLSVLQRGMEEFPESHTLKVFYLLLLRFAFQELEEDSVKKSTANLPLSMDLRYAIYAVDRKRSQELASASLGRGNVNAINLMEYDSGLERARKAHTECIAHLKAFWHLVGRRQGKMTRDPTQMADKMLDELGALDKATTSATEAYESLLHKYPTSLAVLTGYSHFCDVVLNDGVRSRELREKAMSEEAQTSTPDEATLRATEDQARRSQSSASETASFRSRVARTVASWIHTVMAEENQQVFRLRFRGRVLVALLVIGITASFVVSNVVLYSTEAKKYMRLVRRAGELRINMATAAFSLRTQMMAAGIEDYATVLDEREKIVLVAEEIRSIHYENYRNVVSPEIADHFNSPAFAAFLPTGGFWTSERLNLWDMINDGARRSELAGWTSPDDLRNTSYALPNIGDNKRNIAYVHENWLRTLAPSLDVLITGYEQQMQRIGRMISSVIQGSAAASSLVVVVLAVVLLRSLVRWLQNLQHKQMACCLAMSLPRSVARKLYLFYHKVDIEVRLIEDEELERMYMEGKIVMGDEESGRKREQSANASPMHSPGRALTADNLARHVEKLQAPTEPADDFRVHVDQDDAKHETPQRIPGVASLSGKGAQYAQKLQSPYPPDDETGVQADQPTDSTASHKTDTASPAVAPEAGEAPGKASILRETLETAAPFRPDLHALDDAGTATVLLVPRPTAQSGGPDADEGSEGAGVQKQEDHDEQSVDSGEAERNEFEIESDRVDDEDDDGQPAVDAADEENQASGSHGRKRASESMFPTVALKNQPASPTLSALLVDLPPAPTTLPRAGSGTSHGDGIEYSSRSKVQFALPGGDEGERSPAGRRSSLKSPIPTDLPIQQVPSTGEVQDDFSVPRESKTPTRARARSGSIDGHSTEGDEADTRALEINEVDPAFRKRVKERLERERGFFLQTTVYTGVFLVLLGFNLLFHLYPARTISDLVNLAPMIDLASRRVFHTLALSHLTRELVLDDGFSRLSKPSMVGAINDVAERLEDANHAIRFGNAQGVKVGADVRNEEHNRVMYGQGCPWRDDPTNCTMASKPNAADSGLLFLVNTYLDSVKSVVMRYAGGVEPDNQALLFEVDGYMPSGFEHVELSRERAAQLDADNDMKFLLENFEGDMTHGFRLVMRMFSAEADTILAAADAESELLYAVFILLIVVCFYTLLFRKTIRCALVEADKAREFVLRQPIHTLEDAEHQAFASFFSPDVQIGGGGGAGFKSGQDTALD